MLYLASVAAKLVLSVATERRVLSLASVAAAKLVPSVATERKATTMTSTLVIRFKLKTSFCSFICCTMILETFSVGKWTRLSASISRMACSVLPSLPSPSYIPDAKERVGGVVAARLRIPMRLSFPSSSMLSRV